MHMDYRDYNTDKAAVGQACKLHLLPATTTTPYVMTLAGDTRHQSHITNKRLDAAEVEKE